MHLDVPDRPLTLDDVARIADSGDNRCFELSGGALVVIPPAAWRHQWVGMRLCAWFLSRGYLGRVTCGVGVRTGEASGRIPDLVMVRGPVLADTVWLEPQDVVLVVEVVSADSEFVDHYLKPVEYAHAGIPHFWRIELDGTVAQHCLAGDRYVQLCAVPLDDILAGEVAAGSGPMRREAEKSWWLHLAIAGELVASPDLVMATAHENLRLRRQAHPDESAALWFDHWERFLGRGPDAVLAVLTARTELATDLRQNTIFGRVLTDHDRLKVLNAFNAIHPRRPA